MKVRVQMAIDIFTALVTLHVCLLNVISRTTPLKMPQVSLSAGLDQCVNRRTIRYHHRANRQRHVLASTFFATRALQIP
jgi:hypothetical protein